MHGLDNITVIFIVLTVLFFMFFGIAILVIIDHKARIPDSFHRDPWSITGMRRDHPMISFLTTMILGAIIFALLSELIITFAEKLGAFSEAEKPQILKELNEQRFTEKMRHFHNEPEQDLVNMGKKPVCFYCHGDYPHSKQRMVRTLLNMHTQFVGCMTCHNDPKKIDEKSLSFYWLNYSGISVSGPPFGTSIDPKTGNLVTTDNYYAKIVAMSESKGESTLLELTEDNPEVKEFLEVREKLTDADRESVKKRFHRTVTPKGRFCTRCHTSDNDGYISFSKLGFSERRVNDLTNLNIVGIVQKYKKFYMPSLTRTNKAESDDAVPVGKPVKKPPAKPANKPAANKKNSKETDGWWK
ncbi:MAG: multiheme c-type cytochrome [Gammaproteobacteria bacterium]|nr:multiheme c-type cytochrome [Gammaproteobacteria bacterium]MDH5652302.1 multiheme c-type cytochrome [Gammaproteobacteria bacterium]